MIHINLDLIMAKRGIGLMQLSRLVGITPANLSRIKSGKAKQIRLNTLDTLCRVLNCEVKDILEFVD
ncbi:MAG: helix-turn-helix domain-containing protein [Clostridiales bacterium]|jgi:putative transcriptional regulator|nr:helix-turn-helix domain-containing protein [Clostridiales bacterium]